MDFENPAYLLLLIFVPIFIAWGWRTVSALGMFRGLAAITVRVAFVCLLIAALAGLTLSRESDARTALFLVDRSESVPAAQRRLSLDFAKNAARSMQVQRDRVGMIAFDRNASIEQLPNGDLAVEQLGSGPGAQGTNIAAALRTALALFPPDAARRIVLASDGVENVDDALREAETYAAAGIPIDVLPLQQRRGPEVLVEQLSAPAFGTENETAPLHLSVYSSAAIDAQIRLYDNDVLVDLGARDRVRLEPGYNRFSFPVTLHGNRAHRFRAVVQPDSPAADTDLENNEGLAFTAAGGASRVLIVHEGADAQDQQDAEIIAAALRQGGILSEVVECSRAPLTVAGLLDCGLVILSNVSALTLGPAAVDALAVYVREVGGGLVAVGGDNAFSVGGYRGTPLEEVLPVETNRSRLKLLSTSLVIVLDRSGSMIGQKLNRAKSAAIGAVQLMQPFDRVGLVAFDYGADWIVPLSTGEHKAAIIDRIGAIGAGGGTNMYPALEEALSVLRTTDSNVKHVILLTDGQSEPGDDASLTARFLEAGITVSAIALGDDADRPLLERIAKRTHGRMYAPSTADPLPQIFIRETMLASRSGLYERSFAPVRRDPTPGGLMGALRTEVFPQLHGYVITALKRTATSGLVRPTSEGDDPIIAYWQAGVGRAVAVTTGHWTRWGNSWAQWQGFSRLWGQIARYAQRAADTSAFQISSSIDGDILTAQIDANDLPPAAFGTLQLRARLVDPAGQAAELPIHAHGPGRYEASFPVSEKGVYLVALAYQYSAAGKIERGQVHVPIALNYSRERAAVGENLSLLTELARRTRGRVLNEHQADAVFEDLASPPHVSRRVIWEDLVRLALLLFVLDVAVRRVIFSPAEILRALRERMVGAPVAVNAAATLDRLRNVRREGARPTASATPEARLIEPRRDERGVQASRDEQVSGGAGELPPAAPPGALRRSPEAGEAPQAARADDLIAHGGSYSERLLRAKRAARARQEGAGQDESEG